MNIDKDTPPPLIFTILPKQAYEWVKTGHWTRNEFETWVLHYSVNKGRVMAEDLLDAMEGIQDWNNTAIGDLMDELRGYSKED